MILKKASFGQLIEMSPVELVDSWGRRFCRGRWGNTRRCRSAGTHVTCIKSVFLIILFLIIFSYFKWVNHLVLRRPQEAGLHPRVAPQPLHNHPQLVRELPVLSWSWCHREELSRIVLRENMSISNQLRLCIQSKDANVSVSRFKTMHLFIQDCEDASPMNPNPMFGTTFHLCRSLCKLFLNSCLRTSQQYECLARS